MAASITTSTRFTIILLGYDTIRKVINSIGWATDETPAGGGGVNLDRTGLARTTNDADNLAVAQEIYASTNGFQDAAGNPITPTLSNYEYPITVAELEANGIVNPLVAGYEDRLENKRKMQGYEAQGLVKAKIVGGREQIEQSVDFVTKDFSPKSANYDYPLRRFLVNQENDTQIRITLLIPSFQSPTFDELENYSPIVAFLAWLESIRQTGSVVGSDLATGTLRAASLSNRSFDIVLSPTNTLRIRYSTMGYTARLSKYDEVNFRMTRESGTIDADALRDYFQSETISVPSADITVPVAIGDKSAVAKFQRHDIDENRSVEFVHDTQLYHGKIVSSGRLFTLPVGPSWGIGLQYEELTITNSVRTLQYVPGMNAVHFENQSADGIIQLNNPLTTVKYPGTDRVITIHNADRTYNVEVRDWDADTIIILRPGEHFDFRMSLNQSGRKGRMIDEDLPDRKLQYRFTSSSDGAGIIFASGYWDLWSPGFRLIPFSTTAHEHHDDDAFTVLSTAHPTTAQGNINDVAISSFTYRGVVEIELSGELEVEWFVRLVTDPGTTGQIGNYNAFRLYHFPADGSDPTYLTEDVSGAWGGDAGEETYEFKAVGIKVEKGDKIFAGIRYYSTSVVFQNDLRMTDERRSLRLERQINKEWIA